MPYPMEPITPIRKGLHVLGVRTKHMPRCAAQLIDYKIDDAAKGADGKLPHPRPEPQAPCTRGAQREEGTRPAPSTFLTNLPWHLGTPLPVQALS